MGSWSAKPFGNDTALDFADELIHSKKHELIDEKLDHALNLEELDTDECEEIVAISRVVASSAHEKLSLLSTELKQWINSQGFYPTIKQVKNCHDLCVKVLEDSELQNLWDEEDSNSWKKNMAGLIDELASIKQENIFIRAPKKASMPRSLIKLLEHPEFKTNIKFQKSADKKFDAIKDLNEKSKVTDYEYPLVICAKYDLVDKYNELIEKGAKCTKDIKELTLEYAVFNKNLEFCKWVLNQGAQLIKEYQITLETPMRTVFIAPCLFTAVKYSNVEIVEFLLAQGLDIHQKDLNGESLIYKASETGNIDILQYLIDKGLDVNQRKKEQQVTALQWAVQHDQFDSCRVLLENGAEVNALEIWGGCGKRFERSSLYFAQGNKEIESLLIQFGGKLINREITDSKYDDTRIIPAYAYDKEEYAELRARAMKPSLLKVGRYDEKRVRSRFLENFSEEETFRILFNGELAGIYVIKEQEDSLYLAHLYIDPDYQNKKLGTFAMEEIKNVAKKLNKPITLGALKQSRSNDFYQSHGFVFTHEDEFDNYYKFEF